MSRMVPNGKYYYSFDEDDWNCAGGYDSVEEALADGREAAPAFADEMGMEPYDRTRFLNDGRVFIGKGFRFEPTVDADMVLDQIRTDADEETCGCHETDYLDDPALHRPKEERDKWRAQVDKLSDMLTQTFNRWAKETDNEPPFTMIDDVTEHPIKETDNA